MVRVNRVIAALNLLQVAAQLGLVQVVLADDACLLHKVVCQHGQTGARSRLSKPKDVKLPVGLCILQVQDRWMESLLIK